MAVISKPRASIASSAALMLALASLASRADAEETVRGGTSATGSYIFE